MSATVTVFGAALVVCASYCVLFHRKWLVPLICVSAISQAPSVVELRAMGAWFGLGAFTLTLAIVWAHGTISLVLRHRQFMAGFAREQATRPWIWFAAIAVVSAVLWPAVFSGAPIFAPLDKEGVDGSVDTLRWTANHLAQVLNVVLLGGLFVWVHGFRGESGAASWFLKSAVFAMLVAVAVGMQQRLAWNGLVPMWAEFWASNPTYAQDYESLAGAVPRVSWPFVDPSYASAFFAAMFGGFLTMFLAGQRTNAALLGLMVSLFALGNTLGATGSLAVIVVVVLAAAVVLLVAVRRPTLAGALAYRILLLSLAAGCVALGGFLVLRHYDLLVVFGEAMRNALAGRSHTLLGDIRPHADLMSLKLLVETWGLGVGMGSHRGSSYLITLAANTGVLGLVTFLAANVMHFTLLTRRFIRHPDAPSAFFLGSGISVLIAVSIAIPDQNWPVYWILILGGFACVICPLEGEKMREITPGGDARTVDQEASRAG